MAIPCSTKDLESKKFVEKPDGSGQVAVRVSETGGSFLTGIEFDAIEGSYPNLTTEVYEYYTGGLAGTLVATITVIYTDNTKCDITSVVRT